METTEFSFVLKPSTHGIGVFAAHDIPEGTYLRIFGKETLETNLTVRRKKSDVPAQFQDYCIDDGDYLIGPEDFGAMSVGWYLNHSSRPTAIHKDFDFYAARDIAEGEEILIDYKTLGEPEEAREAFYSES